MDRTTPTGTISTCISCGVVARFDGKTWLCGDCKRERDLES